MSTERQIELIHGEIDGTNSPGESVELRKILERDETARQLHEDMTCLGTALDNVEEVEVPAGLRESIRAAIAARRKVAAPLPFRTKKAFVFRGVPGLRLAVALAAGLVVGLVVGPKISTGAPGWNPEDFGGSMMPGSSIDSFSATVEIDVDRLSGTIHATQEDKNSLVFLNISADAPIEVRLAYDPDKVDLTSFARQEGRFDAIETRDGQVVLSVDGDLRCTVVFARRAPAETSLQLEYRRDGILLGEDILRLDRVK